MTKKGETKGWLWRIRSQLKICRKAETIAMKKIRKPIVWRKHQLKRHLK